MTLKLYSTGNTPVTFFPLTQARDPGNCRSVPQLRRISRHSCDLAASAAAGLEQQERQSLDCSSLHLQPNDTQLGTVLFSQSSRQALVAPFMAALDEEEDEEEDLDDEDDDLEEDDDEDLEDEDEDDADFDDEDEGEDVIDDDEEDLDDEDEEED